MLSRHLVEKKTDEVQRRPDPAEKLGLGRHGDDEKDEKRHLILRMIAAIEGENARQGGERSQDWPVDSHRINGEPGGRARDDEGGIKPDKAASPNQLPDRTAEEIQA